MHSHDLLTDVQVDVWILKNPVLASEMQVTSALNTELQFGSKGGSLNLCDSSSGAPVILYRERKRRLCPSSHLSPHEVMEFVNSGEKFGSLIHFKFSHYCRKQQPSPGVSKTTQQIWTSK